jgi:hypothetical protein
VRYDSPATALIKHNAMLRTCDHVLQKNEIPVTPLGTFLDLVATLRLCNDGVKALAELSVQRIVATSAMDSGERLS